MKPVVLVDMDGPLADFDRHFFEEALLLHCEFDIADIESQTRCFLTDHMPVAAQRRRMREMVDSAGWFGSLPVTLGAKDGMALLGEVADVWICTKPLEVNPTCRDEKARWLAQHFGSHWLDKLIITPDKSRVVGDVLLDDAPKASWIPRAIWEPVIFTAPFNGAESEWADYQHWTWGDPIEKLFNPTLWEEVWAA